MIDLEKIRALYNFSKNVSLSDVQTLLKAAKKRSFEPGEYLIKVGDTNPDPFLIIKGLVRSFKVTEKGDEITTLLRWEYQIVVNINKVMFDNPSDSHYEALEPTNTFTIDFELLQSIISNNPKLNDNRKHLLRKELLRAYQRVETFILLSPEERYLDFIKTNPDIVNRVPNKYIAHILGITPVSLSRIRKRIAERKI